MYLMVTSKRNNNNKSSYNNVCDTRWTGGFLRFQNQAWQMVWSEAPHSCSTCLQGAAPLVALLPPLLLAVHYLFCQWTHNIQLLNLEFDSETFRIRICIHFCPILTHIEGLRTKSVTTVQIVFLLTWVS